MKYCIVSKRNTLQTITVTNSSSMEYVATLFPGRNLFSFDETSSMRRKKIVGEINYFVVEDKTSSNKVPASNDEIPNVDENSGVEVKVDKTDSFSITDSATIKREFPDRKKKESDINKNSDKNLKVQNKNKEVK